MVTPASDPGVPCVFVAEGLCPMLLLAFEAVRSMFVSLKGHLDWWRRQQVLYSLGNACPAKQSIVWPTPLYNEGA